VLDRFGAPAPRRARQPVGVLTGAGVFAFVQCGRLWAVTTPGTTHKTHLPRLDIGVVGRGSLNEHDAGDVVRQVLVRAAEDFGFDAADLVTW
jgi:hypothetical protein